MVIWDLSMPEDKKKKKQNDFSLVKSSLKLLVFFNQSKYTYRISITKWSCGLTDKRSNQKYIELPNREFRTSEKSISRPAINSSI